MDTILLSWLCDKVWLMFAAHTEISDRRHPAQRVHLQALPSRTQTGMLLGDESPGCSPPSLQQIQSWPPVRPLIDRSLNLVIFPYATSTQYQNFPLGDVGLELLVVLHGLQLLPRHWTVSCSPHPRPGHGSGVSPVVAEVGGCSPPLAGDVDSWCLAVSLWP